MDLHAEKLSLIQQITQIQEMSIITKIKEVLEKNQEDDIELKNALNRAFGDVELGRTKPHEEVKKKYEKWL